MAIGKGLLAKINALLIWRVLLVLFILANITLAGKLWMSGGDETADAFASGRRILYTLENSKIEGKQITSEELAKSLKPDAAKQEPEPEAKPAETTKEEAKPEVKPEAEKTPEAPAETTETKAPDAAPAAEAPPAAETPENTQAPAETPATPPAEATAPAEPATPEQVAPPADPAAAPAPETAAPATPEEQSAAPAPEDQSQAGPVAPEPPVYNQAMPAAPVDTSAIPAVAPAAAPQPPLLNQTAPAIKPSSQKLPEANSSIMEKATEGSIPVVAQDGTKAWKYYAKPFQRSGKKPMIAIIVTGLGQNKQVTEHALALSENITLSFSPYAHELERWGASARLAGHELMLDLPLEPANFPAADPGPHGLLTSKPPEENESRLRWLMARVPTSIGFITPKNERYTTSVEHMKLLLQSLTNRGLMVVMGRDTSKDETKEIMQNTTAASLTVDFIIDEDLSDATIKAKLASMEQLATQRGYAVGMAQPYPLTIAQLKSWSETLSAKGILLVPVSAIAKENVS